MKSKNRVAAYAAACLLIAAPAVAEPAYDQPLIPEIAHADVYNAVMSNLLINYWDGEGDFEGKDTGLWEADWMGDSQVRGVDNLAALFADPRLLPEASDVDRADTRRDLLEKVHRTIEYGTFALGKAPAALLGYVFSGTLSGMTEGEFYAAIAGGLGYAGGYELAALPEYADYAATGYESAAVRERYRDGARSYANLIQFLFSQDALARTLAEQASFELGWAASFTALTMYRVATSDTAPLQRWSDRRMADRFLARFDEEPEPGEKPLSDDSPELVRALLLRAQLTGNTASERQALEIVDAIVPTFQRSLSTNLAMIDSYLAAYEVKPEPAYLQHVEALFADIRDTLVVEDPLHPAHLIVAHDVGIAEKVKEHRWAPDPEPGPDSGPAGVWRRYPACTGCNHFFLQLVHRYDALINR